MVDGIGVRDDHDHRKPYFWPTHPSVLLPQTLQARLVTTGTLLGLEPKLLGSEDDIAEEVCVPSRGSEGLCPPGDRLPAAYASLLAMRD